MAKRMVGRCGGCATEIVLAREGPTTDRVLPAPMLKTFLITHKPCRAAVRDGPFFTLHELDA